MTATTRLSKSLSLVAMLSVLERQIVSSLQNTVHARQRRCLRSSTERLSRNSSIENRSLALFVDAQRQVCLSRS